VRLGLVAGFAVLAGALAWAGSPAPLAEPPVVVSVAGNATGFAVGPGRAVTVAHVLDGAATTVRRGGGPPLPARVLRLDRRADLALLAVPGLSGRRLRLAAAVGGQRVTVAVRRGGAERPARVRRAIVARLRGPGAAPPLRRPALELRARVREGDSGAPVLTAEGRLAGVVFARSSEHAATAYAVDSSLVARLLAGRRQ
jgi:S1-C subfamily serine protease